MRAFVNTDDSTSPHVYHKQGKNLIAMMKHVCMHTHRHQRRHTEAHAQSTHKQQPLCLSFSGRKSHEDTTCSVHSSKSQRCCCMVGCCCVAAAAMRMVCLVADARLLRMAYIHIHMSLSIYIVSHTHIHTYIHIRMLAHRRRTQNTGRGRERKRDIWRERAQGCADAQLCRSKGVIHTYAEPRSQ